MNKAPHAKPASFGRKTIMNMLTQIKTGALQSFPLYFKRFFSVGKNSKQAQIKLAVYINQLKQSQSATSKKKCWTVTVVGVES